MVHAPRRILCAIFIGLALTFGLATACTPEEVAIYNSLDPADQVKVVEAIQDQQEQAQIEYLTALHEHYVSIQMDPFLTCVRHHESDRGPFPHTNGYGAQNPVSTASGAYQWLNSSWASVSRMAGHSGYPTAASAPWYVQDAVSYWAMTHGYKSAWSGTGC